MTSFTENFEKLSDLQKQGLEPVRNLTSFAVEAFEKLTRQNYAFYGDVMEFAISQARLVWSLVIIETRRIGAP